MSSTPIETLVPPAEPVETGMNVVERAVAIFVRPADAWRGLRHQVQFWFPMLLLLLSSTAFTIVLWERAYIPDFRTAWEQAVDNGQMTQEQVDKTEARMAAPAARVISAVSYGCITALFMLVAALGTWFGVGFILGTKFSYRLALEVAAWSALIVIPAQLVTGGLAWTQESLKHATLGLGALLPESETPSKLMGGLKAFLDAIGPFSIWSLVVSILGASQLSGAPRRSVAWVSVGLYLVFALFGAAMAAMFGPGR